MVRIISKIKNDFKVNIKFNDIYRMSTIKLISDYIINEKNDVIQEENNITLLNDKKKVNVFAFPSIGAFGLAYSKLAKLVDTHSFYAFDFIEQEDMINEYIKIIMSIQMNGPYILFGYSAGGNLAYEGAAALMNRGFEVSDIILLDSFQNNILVSDEEMLNSVIEAAKEDYFYKNFMEIDDIEDMAINKMKMYIKYFKKISNEDFS